MAEYYLPNPLTKGISINTPHNSLNGEPHTQKRNVNFDVD